MDRGLANQEPTQRTRRASWRVATLTAASAVSLAACGGSASGTGAAAPPGTRAPAPSAVATPGPGGGAVAAVPAATADVGIVNFKFTPATLTVKVGTTVAWTNRDTIAHTVNFTAAGINSSVLNQNERFTHTFTAPGTYDYICSIHPFMHGSVTVTA